MPAWKPPLIPALIDSESFTASKAFFVQPGVAAGGLVALFPAPWARRCQNRGLHFRIPRALPPPAKMNVPAAGPGVSTAAAPAAVIVFGIIVSVQPWNLKQFHLSCGAPDTSFNLRRAACVCAGVTRARPTCRTLPISPSPVALEPFPASSLIGGNNRERCIQLLPEWLPFRGSETHSWCVVSPAKERRYG